MQLFLGDVLPLLQMFCRRYCHYTPTLNTLVSVWTQWYSLLIHWCTGNSCICHTEVYYHRDRCSEYTFPQVFYVHHFESQMYRLQLRHTLKNKKKVDQ